MGLMTSGEAEACTITRIEKRVAGSKASWVVAVNDADGNYYDMEFTKLGSDPSKSVIKTAVLAELVKMEKQPAKVVVVTTDLEESDDKGIGETLG
jgi:hypothetical protein